MTEIIIIVLIAIAIPGIIEYIKFSKKIKRTQNNINQNEKNGDFTYPSQYTTNQQPIYPYHRVELLTGNEREFYNKLKQITYGKFDILAKIRIADLVNVNQELQRAEWGAYFSKISSKHIDFAIARDMRIILLIELDDKSHWKRDRQERDIFVNDIMNQCGYRLIRTSGSTEPIIYALRELKYEV